MEDYIKPFSFVEIVHNRFKKANGIVKGETVFVAAVQAFPLTQRDPYTQRIKFWIHRLKDDHIDTESGLYLIDPRSVRKISEEENSRLLALAHEKADATIN